MSAICGLFYKHKCSKITCDFLIKKMLGSISAHIGDNPLFWQQQNIAIGQINNKFNAQSQCDNTITSDNNIANPVTHLYDSELQLAITAYVRIDNRNQLCQLLNIQNSAYLSDHKLILLLYQKYNTDFANKILGDFAIAIWDDKQQQLTCVTDIMNCRPVFYFNNDELFAFSTEIRALHTLSEVKREPDLIRIANQIVIDNHYISKDQRSYFDNIKYLPGATVLTVTTNRVYTNTYWQPNIFKKLQLNTEEEYVAAFNEIFTQALNARTNTNLPIGVKLSGGLDSSAITSMLLQQFKNTNRMLYAFSNVNLDNYQGNIQDEREYIEMLRGNNLEINYIANPTVGPFYDLLGLITHVESPNYISQQYVHREIDHQLQQKNIRVILSGVYGEMGSSYASHNYLASLFFTGRWHSLLKESYLQAQVLHKNWLNVLFRGIVSPLIPQLLREVINSSIKERYSHIGLPLNKEFVNRYSSFLPYKNKMKYGINNSMFNQRQNQLNFIHYKQNTHPLYCYMEKSGVEVLYPYLDRRILEFCLQMPDSMRVKHGYNRYLIRRAMRGIMPEAICKRITKTAFIPDYMERYRQDLPKAQQIIDYISNNNLVQEIIDIKALQQMICQSTSNGVFMGEQNALAFMIVPTTLALGVFLTTF